MTRLAAILSGLALLIVAGCHDASSTGGTGKSTGTSAGDSKSGGSESTSSQKAGSVPSDVVKIALADQARAGIRVAAVSVRSMPRVLTVAGQVIMDEKHTQHIGVLADGRIERVYVLPGDAVHRGQTLATLHSHTVHETVAALTQAFAAQTRQQSAVTFATQARDRYSHLFAIQAASLEEKQRSEQELAQAQKDLTDAAANVRAEREHLAELLQVAPESLKPGTLYDKELIPVRAVGDGVVITRAITPGQVVTTGDEAFVTSDLSTVWVSAAVNQSDVSQVHVGQSAVITTRNSRDDKGQRGWVAMLGDLVDAQTRTLPVRLSVPNPATTLRPGMFTSVDIGLSASRTAIFVPSGALQDVNGFRVVFVTADGVTFQARPVTTGLQSGDLVEVIEGLQPSDRVVADGAFMVKGELLKGTVGEG